MKLAAGRACPRPQDRPDLARHAAGQPDQRARLRHAAGRHVFPRAVTFRSTASSRRGWRWSWPLCWANALQGPNVTIFDVLAATDYVTPAIEIIDARIEQFDRHTKVMRKVFDTISDNAANAGIITGGRPVKPTRWTCAGCGALLYKNGVIEETGVAAAVLNHPATAWPGWPTSWRPGANAWRPARSCWVALHPAHQRRGGRYVPCRLRPAGVHRFSDSFKQRGATMQTPYQPLQASHPQPADRKSACGWAGQPLQRRDLRGRRFRLAAARR
jgi:hypothetical protein